MQKMCFIRKTRRDINVLVDW